MEQPAAGRESFHAVEWRDGGLRLLDQRRLPQREEYLTMNTAPEVARAIHGMVVRGAPAIGIAAAYAVVLAARTAYQGAGDNWRDAIEADLTRLAASRPTAVNLRWAITRMRGRFDAINGSPEAALLAEAQAIHDEDRAANLKMGKLGADWLPPKATVLTHCNAGALATGGYGTALGVIRAAHARGSLKAVYVDETRPWLQGARLTAWELSRDGMAVTVLADAAAAHLMATHGVDCVIVGADRIAANGDTANKIGTYMLALSARAHGVKFMVVAPSSTFDLTVLSGRDIPVEVRDAAEVLSHAGMPVAAAGAGAWNPVFDVTPAALIDVIVTEKGLIERPDAARVAQVIQG
ncbi:MAG TPA: S-methyl-5-thioribose-1-phosphate isomerase [Gammaproteobacteria bacterium]|nr:S-methyl-5-thioribose-1-phosphate isomerase [Gammaproteobacteria bacterium]